MFVFAIALHVSDSIELVPYCIRIRLGADAGKRALSDKLWVMDQASPVVVEPHILAPSTERSSLSTSTRTSRQETPIDHLFLNSAARDRLLSQSSWKRQVISRLSSIRPTYEDSLQVFRTLLETLTISHIPGPRLLRLQEEFSDAIGHGAQCDVLAASERCERLLDSKLRDGYDTRTTATLQAFKAIAIKRTKYFDIGSGSTITQPNSTIDERLRRLLLYAQRDIETLCQGPFRKHPNIVKLLAWGLDLDILEDPNADSPRIPLLILERAAGDLREYLEHHRNEKSRDEFIRDYQRLCVHIGMGLDAIHRQNMTHGDLKPENVLIFISETGITAKLCDFGLAVAEKSGRQAFIDYEGTPGWVPPEASEKLNSASLVLCDVFVYGLLVWSIATLDGTSPILNEIPRHLTEVKLYHQSYIEVHDAKIVQGEDDMNRVVHLLRGSLHQLPHLRERQPWNYLNKRRFPMVAPVSNPSQSSMSLTAYENVMQFAEWARTCYIKLPNIMDILLRPFYWCYYLVRSGLRKCLRWVFPAIREKTTVVYNYAARMWTSSFAPERQQTFEAVFQSFRSRCGQSFNLSINGLSVFEHPPGRCCDPDVMREMRIQMDEKLQSKAFQPRSLEMHPWLMRHGSFNDEDVIYALARLRARLPLCCWGSEENESTALSKAFARNSDLQTLAWLCNGPVGQEEFKRCSLKALWSSICTNELPQSQMVERILLLLYMGAGVDDQISEEAPLTAFGQILLSTSCVSNRDSVQSNLAMNICQHFQRTAAQRVSPQARFFMTGQLPDEDDIDRDYHFSTSALHEAIAACCYDAVHYLLSSQFPVHILDQQGQSPYQLSKALAQGLRDGDPLMTERLRIVDLLRNSTQADERLDLPVGWTAKELGSGGFVYKELHTNSITFKVPRFSLFGERRLLLGYKNISGLGNSYIVDLVRFISSDHATSEPTTLGAAALSFDDEWFRKNIAETNAREFDMPTMTRILRVSSSTVFTFFSVLRSNYLNIFLIFVPLSVVARAVGWSSQIVIFFNSLAIVSLSSILCLAVRQIMLKFEVHRSAFMAISDGAVEFLVGITAIVDPRTSIVLTDHQGRNLRNIQGKN